MDIFVVHHIRQNQGYRPLGPEAWTNVWLIEAEAMAQAGNSIAKLFGAIGAGAKALVRAAGRLLTAAPEAVPVRVATRRQHIDLAARNDDRAAA